MSHPKRGRFNNCVLCGEVFVGWGHNAQPLDNGRCCDVCNDTKVVPERLRRVRGEVITAGSKVGGMRAEWLDPSLIDKLRRMK
jgi:hypothetical protein